MYSPFDCFAYKTPTHLITRPTISVHVNLYEFFYFILVICICPQFVFLSWHLFVFISVLYKVDPELSVISLAYQLFTYYFW